MLYMCDRSHCDPFALQHARIQLMLYENTTLRIEGVIIVRCLSFQPLSWHLMDRHVLRDRIQGFDEYMNLVLDEAEELDTKRKTRKALGTVSGNGLIRRFRAQSA